MSDNQYQIPAPNYTQCPNVLFDYWLRILGYAELKVFMVIIRKTIGWHKADLRDQICGSMLEKYTGLTATNISLAVKSLINRNLISKEVLGSNGNQKVFYKLIIQNNSTPSCKKTPPVKCPTKESNAFLRSQEERSKEEVKKKNDIVSEKEVVEDRSSSEVNSDRSFDPVKYRLPNGKPLSLRMMKSLQKYSPLDKQKLYSNIAYFEERIKKGANPENQEAYLQKCINEDYAGKESKEWQNKIYAQWQKEEFKLDGITIMKSIVKLFDRKGNLYDKISLSASSKEFIECIENFKRKFKD